MELEDVAREDLHRGRRLDMQRNKVYAITVNAAVAEQLGVDEELLHKMSVGLEPEDGVIWVYGIGVDAIMAFTNAGVDELKTFSKRTARTPIYLAKHRRIRPKLSDYGNDNSPFG